MSLYTVVDSGAQTRRQAFFGFLASVGLGTSMVLGGYFAKRCYSALSKRFPALQFSKKIEASSAKSSFDSSKSSSSGKLPPTRSRDEAAASPFILHGLERTPLPSHRRPLSPASSQSSGGMSPETRSAEDESKAAVARAHKIIRSLAQGDFDMSSPDTLPMDLPTDYPTQFDYDCDFAHEFDYDYTQDPNLNLSAPDIDDADLPDPETLLRSLRGPLEDDDDEDEWGNEEDDEDDPWADEEELDVNAVDL
eukprot:NODE_2672_length_1065_cov_25.349409_g2227_i0.p1 GENE.NODE_2672_length_1065_cov_25.349409_g2227_i0~~NODE_2672_length_1065_cov_25.349409_g2227_i0.p1  ORF type:complete len:250 (+),score=54.11 NODE_2672_length_1065_cov_25.349409_g2227_i0:209-958(+)